MQDSRNLLGCQIYSKDELPDDWYCEPLGNRIKLEYGASLTEEVRVLGDYPVFGSNGAVGTHNRFLEDGPGILVGRKGTVGAVHFSHSAFWPIDTTYYVKPIGGDNWRYLYYLLTYLNLGKLNAATGVPGLSRRDALALRGAFPSLDEQREIARILDTIDHTLKCTELAIEKARRVKQSVLQSFFDDGVGRISSADKPGDYIANGWRLVRTGQLLASEPKNGISPPAQGRPPGYPTFSIAAVRNGKIDLSGEHLKYVQLPEIVADKFAVHTGDLLVVRGNANPGLVGLCGMIDSHPEQCIYPDILKRVVLRDDEDGILSRFACIAWNHPLVHNQILKLAKTSNGTLKINTQDIKRVILPVPPKQKQQEFLTLHDACDKRITTMQNQLSVMMRLKSGLMKDLMTGKVRVQLPTTLRQPQLELPLETHKD